MAVRKSKIEWMHEAFVAIMRDDGSCGTNAGTVVSHVADRMMDYITKQRGERREHRVCAIFDDCVTYLQAGCPFGVSDRDSELKFRPVPWHITPGKLTKRELLTMFEEDAERIQRTLARIEEGELWDEYDDNTELDDATQNMIAWAVFGEVVGIYKN